MKLGPKLISIFLLVGIIPLLAVTWLVMSKTDQALSSQAFDQLTSLRALKKNQVQAYYQEKQNHLKNLLDMVEANHQSAFTKLDSIQELKKTWIESYFEDVRKDIRSLVASNDISRALDSIKEYEQTQKTMKIFLSTPRPMTPFTGVFLLPLPSL